MHTIPAPCTCFSVYNRLEGQCTFNVHFCANRACQRKGVSCFTGLRVPSVRPGRQPRSARRKSATRPRRHAWPMPHDATPAKPRRRPLPPLMSIGLSSVCALSTSSTRPGKCWLGHRRALDRRTQARAVGAAHSAGRLRALPDHDGGSSICKPRAGVRDTAASRHVFMPHAHRTIAARYWPTFRRSQAYDRASRGPQDRHAP